MATIKVLQANKLYYPTLGGIENLVKDIAEGVNHAATDIISDVLVCQEKGPYQEYEIDGVHVYKAASFGIKYSLPMSLQYILVFRRLCKEYDVVHMHMPFPLADLALFLSGYKGKVILWWHSDIIRQKKALILLKPLLNWTIRRADLITVATENHIKSSTFLEPFHDKCKVIPFGIKTNRFVNLSPYVMQYIAENRIRLGGKKCVLFVGRLVYYKGVDVLLKAMADIDAVLVIIGDGPLAENLHKLANDMSISNRVLFLGQQSDDTITSWYHTCDIFVLPSVENSEAFGLVQLEAMTCGRPVINTNLPTGVPCVSLDGETGRTVAVNDPLALSSAIRELLSDDLLRQKLGQNAKKRALSLFTNESMIHNIARCYRDIISM